MPPPSLSTATLRPGSSRNLARRNVTSRSPGGATTFIETVTDDSASDEATKLFAADRPRLGYVANYTSLLAQPPNAHEPPPQLLPPTSPTTHPPPSPPP